MMDVPLIVTVECRALAYLTPTRDRISPIRTGRRATTLVPRRLRSAVAGEQASGPTLLSQKRSLPMLRSTDSAIHRAASAESPEMRGKAASKFAPEMKKNRAIAAPACAPRGMDAFTRAQYEWGDVRSMTLRRTGWPSDLMPPCKSVDIGE